jgi:hypothetical protein
MSDRMLDRAKRIDIVVFHEAGGSPVAPVACVEVPQA